MSFLRQFAGHLATNLGKQAEEERLRKLQEEMERRRAELQFEFSEKGRVSEKKDFVEKTNATSEPTVRQTVKDGKITGLLVQPELAIDETGAMVRKDRELGEAVPTPVGRPYTVYDGPNRVSMQQMSDGTSRQLGAPSPVREEGYNGVGREMTDYQANQNARAIEAAERAERSEGRSARTAMNAEINSRIGDYASEWKDLKTEKPTDGGLSEFQTWAGRALGDPNIKTPAQAREHLRSKFSAELADEYGVGAAPTEKQGQKPGNSQAQLSVPPAAVEELKKDPSLEAIRDFDAIFGKGAAARVLGSR